MVVKVVQAPIDSQMYPVSAFLVRVKTLESSGRAFPTAALLAFLANTTVVELG